MRSTIKLFVVALLAGVGYSACHKHDTADVTKPTIEITEPLLNDTVVISLDSVHIEFLAKDNSSLLNVAVSIKNNSSGAFPFSDSRGIHQASFDYHSHFVPQGITVPTSMTLSVTATDHNSNSATKSVNFVVKP